MDRPDMTPGSAAAHNKNRLGATPLSETETYFRVWAPKRNTVEVDAQFRGERTRAPLQRDVAGYFHGTVNVGPLATYHYVLDENLSRPDPASCFQPDGVHGASQVIDRASFPWTDQDWQGIAKRDLIIYELHIGCLTEEGTFLTAIDEIPRLVELGVTAVEIMPVAQSPGRWNWGYDGVNPFAVRNSFGSPDDFKRFVNACHAAGIAVILDVVYNHLGPEGNYLADFGPYFSNKHHTPWGSAFNFDGRRSEPVREYVVQNAIYWLDEYHLDGLRLDAVHFMLDDSEPSILTEIRQAADAFGKTVDRDLHLIAEANVFDDELLSDSPNRKAYDAIWCDCLMHSIYSYAVPDLKLTRRDYLGTKDIATALKTGYIYQGKQYHRGEDQTQTGSLISHVGSLIMALQTHDSVGNHPHGKRMHHLTSIEFQKAAAALILLYPCIPMIFMGEEVATNMPFPFFADFEDQRLRNAVDKGRAREYPQHAWDGAMLPSDPQAFHHAKIHDTRNHNPEMWQWYRELLTLRKQGMGEGWLTPQTLTVEHVAHHDLFSLVYEGPDGWQTVLHSRLSRNGQEDEPIEIVSEGEVLLSSMEQTVDDNQELQLAANQAVVTRVRLPE